MPKDNIKQLSTMNWITSDKLYSNSFVAKKKYVNPTLETRKNTSLSYYHAIQTQRKCSPHKNMRLCGLRKSYANNQENAIECQVSKHGVTVKGMAFCGSPFCVTCMGYQRTQRRKKIEKGLIQAERQGYQSFFVTLTIERTNDIQKQVKDLFYGWKLLQDRLSYRMKKQDIQLFMVRNLDITFKPESNKIYHTHLHCIVILDKPLEPFKDKKTKKHIYNFPDFVKTSWVNIQNKRNINCSLQGQHIEKIECEQKISRYVSKFEGMAMELSHFAHKTGKKNKIYNQSMGYMELLGFVHKKHKKSFQVYRDFLKAMHGCRTVSFSRNWNTVQKIVIDGKKKKVVTEILKLPFLEREQPEKEEKRTSLFVSDEWHVYLRSTWDKFILSLKYAHIHGFLQSIKIMLERKPNYEDLYLLYDTLSITEI